MLLDSRKLSQPMRGTAHLRTLTLHAATIALVASTACVSRAQYTETKQERDLCESRYVQLRSKIEGAKAVRETLTQEKSALATEKTVLEAKVATLQTQEQVLGSKLKEREEEARKLQETYDGLVSSLKKELKAGQIEVQQLRDGLRVNVSQDILFDSGSAALDKNGMEVLQRVATELKKTPHQIVVVGHTDNKPIGPALIERYPTNWELAGARAASVVRLFDEAGISTKRLLAESKADVQPVASNKTPEGRAKNRRIEIRLRPTSEG